MQTVWYDAPSHTAGAALAAHLDVRATGVRATGVQAAGVPAIDVRATGVRVRAEDLTVVAAAARELGLSEGTARTLSVQIEAADPPAIQAFWDLMAGAPIIPVRRLAELRPLRNRIHVDVVRPRDEVLRARGKREPSGPFGVMLADDEGNEVDLVPGDPLPGTTDWYALFSPMVHYPNAPRRLVTTAAELADAAGIPLQLDVRPEGLTIAGRKDTWETDPAFLVLAQQIEGAAKDLGLRADPAPLRFVQFGIDALDVPAVRAFWTGFLGYERDSRPDVTDIYDPRDLNPVLFFQQLREPRPQRNRIRFELAGRNRCLVTDPEGNEALAGT
ncbi:VOC family protein [Kribbella sp.]|uniref:VOC family protein n=1 Tax=Kribbella sp. TaxID=1871183 RepID=UPI002D486231|nr:VOC family protein [Kribbella sp.]HZX06852.1 VOC family protein [Kribbella sp.]